ncbi:MAG: hypothetical protein LBR20_07485, partial [Propionibacteriaceae bacterium]|nr:hypothetical protein [Propionibacteriaceae bacterium]
MKTLKAGVALAVAIAVPLGGIFSAVPAQAEGFNPNESVVSRAALEEIVNDSVNVSLAENTAKLAAQALASNAVSALQNSLSEIVVNAVGQMTDKFFTADSVRSLATPLLKKLVHAQLEAEGLDDELGEFVDSAIDKAVSSTLVDKVMDAEIVKSITKRTVEYAVADIMEQVDLGDILAKKVNDLVPARKAAAIDEIYNSGLTTVGSADTMVKSAVPLYWNGSKTVSENNESYYDFTVDAWNINSEARQVS